LHLTGYLAHPLLLLNLLLLLPMRLLQAAAPDSALWATRLAPALMAIALGPPLLYAVAQVADGRGWGRRLLALPLLMLAGVGVSLNNALAVLKALLGIRQGFLRTPKFAVRRREDAWVGSAYVLALDPLIWGELALATYSVALLFVPAFSWGLAPWALLYAGGFGYLAGAGLVQAFRRWRWQRAQPFAKASSPSAENGFRPPSVVDRPKSEKPRIRGFSDEWTISNE
jgi:hypothetical protein